MSRKLHRLLLDYDIMSKEEVEKDARRLNEKYNLGGYEIEASDTTNCWHVTFPMTALPFEEALKIAYDSRCDKEWLRFCERYKCFAVKTELVKRFQPHARRKVCSRPVKEITLPVILVVKPKTRLDLKRVIKLSESTHDKTWVWSVKMPVWNILDDRHVIEEVHIGCKDYRQAMRRKKFIEKLEIDCNFVVMKNVEVSE